MIERGISQDRMNLLWGLVAAVSLVFALRLVNLQILMHTYYSEIAERNRTQVLPQAAPRGRIFTRDSAAVATNKPSFSLIYFPGAARSAEGTGASFTWTATTPIRHRWRTPSRLLPGSLRRTCPGST